MWVKGLRFPIHTIIDRKILTNENARKFYYIHTSVIPVKQK